MQNPFLFEEEEFGYESQFEDESEYYEGEVPRGRGGYSPARPPSPRQGQFKQPSRRPQPPPRAQQSRPPQPPTRLQQLRRPRPQPRPQPRWQYQSWNVAPHVPKFDPDFVQPGRESGEGVRLVQSLLNKVLGLNLPVDGIMSVETRSAIRSFQNQKDSPADGAAGSPAEPAPIEEPPAQTSDDTDKAQEEYDMFEHYDSESDFFELEDEALWSHESLAAETAGGTPSNTRIGAPKPQSFQDNAVKIAQQEWTRWGNGKIKETDPKFRVVLEDYWKTGTGQTRTESNWWTKVPWSAAFISWIMKKAGAGNAFRYSGAHANYIKAAKDNRLANNTNPFKAYRINEISPQPGDLVCACRETCQANYDNISPGMPTHCDIVTEKRPGYISTIGGNVNNTVGKKTVPLDAAGFIKTPKYFAVIRSSLQSPATPATFSPSTSPNVSTGSPDIVNVRGIKVARQIAPKIEALLAAAAAAGVKLSGGGYRSKEQQIKLRIAHCGGNTNYNIYEKPSKQCTPPTAPPGRSMHEKGLAIDFTYNGQGIKSRSNPGFVWLSKNAAGFGLYNLPSEPWHWSINGK